MLGPSGCVGVGIARGIGLGVGVGGELQASENERSARKNIPTATIILDVK
jgi:hypothetical protein